MASFTDDADWGADVADDGIKYPNDGGDYCGDNGSDIYRVANKFTISTLPATDTVSQVDVSIEVATVIGASASAWTLGAYNGNGQADPDADTGAQMYSRCDVSADYYLTGFTDYRTTGVKTHTALGATANSDVEAARDAGTIFSLAWKMDTEALDADRTEFTEYLDGTNPPKLTVTHAAGGTTVSASTDALVLTENAVGINAETSITATKDTLSLTEYNTSLNAETSITVLKDTLTLTEYNAALNAETNITTTKDTLTLTEYNASLSLGIDITATKDTLTLTDYNVSFVTGTNISATSDALTLTEYAASISQATDIQTTVDAITLTDFNVTLSLGANVQAAVDVLTLTEYNVSIVSGIVPPVPDSRTELILSDNRLFNVGAESRTELIAYEDRSTIISGD